MVGWVIRGPWESWEDLLVQLGKVKSRSLPPPPALPLLQEGSRPSPKLSRHPGGSEGWGENGLWMIRVHWGSWEDPLVLLDEASRVVWRGGGWFSPLGLLIGQVGFYTYQRYI